MANILKDHDVTLLEKYRLSSEITDSFDVADLLEESYLKKFMSQLADAIGAPTEKTAASIFIKRYAFIAVISLFSMSVKNIKMNVVIGNIEMEKPEQGKDWLPMLKLKSPSIEEWTGEDREKWRNTVYQELFAKNLFPLIDQFEKTFNLSRLILWENIAVYLFWLYETELKDHHHSNIKEDFLFLVSEAEGRLFGPYNNNPLKKYYSGKQYVEEFQEEVRIRKTCCFTYQLESRPSRCKTCPCTHIAKEGVCFDGESICTTVRSLA
ncbi:MAG: IucA/IucC family C-terminal-domain containing protein [Neobacillus sp.]